MRASTVLVIGAVFFAVAAQAESLRYRGDYSFGHEVNVFCPAINSQCYWLSGDTSDQVRMAMKAAFPETATEPYPVACVVIEAEIDRESPRDGFAADYDGLITVTKLFGTCQESAIVTHGDLQHHRFVLDGVDGEPFESGPDGRVPELDFGENLTITGNTGCNNISGRGILQDQFIRFGPLMSTAMACSPEQDELERRIQKLLASDELLVEFDDSDLVLTAGGNSLRYRLQDWVK